VLKHIGLRIVQVFPTILTTFALEASRYSAYPIEEKNEGIDYFEREYFFETKEQDCIIIDSCIVKI